MMLLAFHHPRLFRKRRRAGPFHLNVVLNRPAPAVGNSLIAFLLSSRLRSHQAPEQKPWARRRPWASCPPARPRPPASALLFFATGPQLVALPRARSARPAHSETTRRVTRVWSTPSTSPRRAGAWARACRRPRRVIASLRLAWCLFVARPRAALAPVEYTAALGARECYATSISRNNAPAQALRPRGAAIRLLVSLYASLVRSFANLTKVSIRDPLSFLTPVSDVRKLPNASRRLTSTPASTRCD